MADEAAGAHDAQHLAEGGGRLAQMLGDLVGVGDVERGVGEGQRVHAGLLVAEVRQAAGGRVRAGGGQRLP